MKLSAKDPSSLPLIKAFCLGYSGQGKSSATIPLTIAGPIKGCPVPGPGLELLVLDFDAKFVEMAYAVLNMMRDKGMISATQRDEALERIDVTECKDNMGAIQVMENRKMREKLGVRGTPTGWTTAVKQLERWAPSLSNNKVLIVDSITHAAQCAVNYCMEMNGKLNQNLSWTDYQCPQGLMSSLMSTVAGLPCSILLLGHQAPVDLYRKTDKIDENTGKPEEELMDVIVAPISIGRAKNIELPARFNHLLLFADEGTGSAVNRYMYTTPKNGVVTKTPFFNAKPRYELTTSLVQYFALRN